MIGSFLFVTNSNPKARAILLDNGEWSCTDKTYELVLNGMFSPKADGPKDGHFGFAKFQAAVGYFRGRVLAAPVPRPGPEGRFEH